MSFSDDEDVDAYSADLYDEEEIGEDEEEEEVLMDEEEARLRYVTVT